MENQFRVMLLVTTMGVMIGEGCSDPSHQHFNFTDPGLIFYLILFNSHIQPLQKISKILDVKQSIQMQY